MAKKMRTINNPLDRQTRNDINYNFGVLDEALSDMATTGTEANERFTRIENDVTKLKKEDKNLSDRIDANKQAIEAMDLDAIKLQGDTAEKQGVEAKKKGDKAEQQGNVSEQKGNVAEEQGVIAETKGIKAEQQGNYAKEMGDYAKEKAEYTAEKTSEIEQAHTDLSQIKVEAVDATQSANTQAEYAKEQGDYAKLVGDEVADKLDEIESVKQDVISKGNITEQQGLKAKEQGDYAQSVIDSYKHVGDWNGSIDYKKNQEVLFNGSTYRAIEDNKGTQPTDKSKWQLIAQRGVDGEGAVASVNGIMPDSDGNVNLGDIADKQYVDSKISEIPDIDLSKLETKTDATAKLTEAKEYTDTQISAIPEVDLTPLETKEDAQAKLTEAKQYTDEKIGDVDLSALETKEDAQAKLVEAKGYTDEEIAKIPDVKDTVDTVNEYEKKINIINRIDSIQIGDKDSREVGVYLQLGAAKHSSSSNAARGSVNISSMNKSVAGNRIYHRNAMIFGGGLITLSQAHERPSHNLVTYLGQYNVEPSSSSINQNANFFVGIGRSETQRKTGMKLDNDGDLFINGQYHTSGADYAEMFEWEDKNPENIDRVALAVTWGDGESIKLANSGDEIIGVVSATAAILGDNPDEWDKRFVTDQFGRLLKKEYVSVNKDGEEEIYEWLVENPEYDEDEIYTPRFERPEWSAIGLMGKLYWIDDGTLEVGDYATVGSNGVATKGTKENGWRVMKRISKNVDGNSGVVKVFFK